MQKEMPLPQQRAKEQMPPKERNFVERLATSVDDFIGDVVTANAMAKEKFDGDSALMHAARGGVTGLIGVGLGAAFDKVLTKSVKEGEIWPSKIKIPLSKEVAQKLEVLGSEHPRIRYFVENATKNFVIGATYNGLAYFSRPMIPSIEAKHLLGSMAVSAADAMGQKGQLREQSSSEVKSLVQEAKLRATEASEREKAYRMAKENLDPKSVEEAARKAWIDELNIKQTERREEWLNAFIEGKNREELMDTFPKPLSKHEYRRMRAKNKTAAAAEGQRVKDLHHKLLTEAFHAKIALDKINSSVKYAEIKNESTQLNLKDKALALGVYVNPVTLLGFDWVVDGVATLVANTKKVRDLRKEYGGLQGKKVPIAPSDARRRYTDRKPYDQKPFSNKDQVYYGKARWNSPKQEVDLEKFD